MRSSSAGGLTNYFYDLAGNVDFTSNMSAPAEERASFFAADGSLRAVDYRWAAGPSATALGVQKYAVEEYRYDALGRRVWLQSKKTCNDAYGMTLTQATECRTSLLRRTIWDGDQELVEIQMPYGVQNVGSSIVTTTPTLWENDVIPVSIPAFNTSHGLADVNPYFGHVVYANGTGIDHPIAITRVNYSTVLDLISRQPRVEVKPPFTITPFWNARGDAPVGVFSNGVQLLCNPPTSQTACVGVVWPFNFSAFDRQRGLTRDNWHGTLLEGKRDKSGLSYARNRYYDPASGRFTQEDPIGLAGGMNLYGFAAGDPVNFSDPFGLCPAFITGKPCSTALAIGVGFIPVLGDAIDIAGAVVGQDLLTGEDISGVGVVATIVGTVLGSGKLAREGVQAAEGLVRGMRNATVRAAVNAGNVAHDAFFAVKRAEGGWRVNKVLGNGRLRPDAWKREGNVITVQELKPNTTTGRQATGASRVKYEQAAREECPTCEFVYQPQFYNP